MQPPTFSQYINSVQVLTGESPGDVRAAARRLRATDSARRARYVAQIARNPQAAFPGMERLTRTDWKSEKQAQKEGRTEDKARQYRYAIADKQRRLKEALEDYEVTAENLRKYPSDITRERYAQARKAYLA